MPAATKTAALNLLIHTREVKLEESGILWIEARSGDVVERYACVGNANDTSHKIVAAQFASEYGEEVEDEPIITKTDGRIFRLKRTRLCHCGAPAQGPPSQYADVCTGWPYCETENASELLTRAGIGG